MRERPFPDNSLCVDSSFVDDGFVDDQTSNIQHSTSSHVANSTTNNIASPMVADLAVDSIEPINNEFSETDDEEEIICMSPDVDFMAHSPRVNQQLTVKIDPISAYFDYDMKSNGDRVYTIDGNKHVMPSRIVVTLQAWNTASQHSFNVETDRQFVEILLVCFIGLNNLVNDNINRKCLRFVQGKILSFHHMFHCFSIHSFILIILLQIFIGFV